MAGMAGATAHKVKHAVASHEAERRAGCNAGLGLALWPRDASAPHFATLHCGLRGEPRQTLGRRDHACFRAGSVVWVKPWFHPRYGAGGKREIR